MFLIKQFCIQAFRCELKLLLDRKRLDRTIKHTNANSSNNRFCVLNDTCKQLTFNYLNNIKNDMQ